MEKDDFLQDDFLRDLIRKSPMDSPSDDFLQNVMEQVSAQPAVESSQKIFFRFLKTSWPFALIGVSVIIFFLTSDLPVSGFLPGKDYFSENLIPYLLKTLSGFKWLVPEGKSATLPVIIIASGILLYLFDRFLFRKSRFQQNLSE